MSTKKKVLLAITRDSKIYECVFENIKHMGYDCELLKIPMDESIIKSKGFLFKLKLFYKLKIRKSKNYIERFGEQNKEKNIIKKIINEGQAYDCCLMIRPDLYSEEIVEALVSNIENTYAYQWDGLNRFPEVLSLVPKFRHFYIYDKNDLNRFPNTSLKTNFYFDCYLKENKQEPKYDIYYLGSYDDRIGDIISVCSKLSQMSLNMKILIYCSRENRGKLKDYPFLTELHHGISYYESLENVFDSKVLLDFGHKEKHVGLSLRPFEALGYHKKMITTNTHINEYDFYNSNNTLIIEDDISINELELFMSNEYERINNDIYNFHSFSGWFKDVIRKK